MKYGIKTGLFDSEDNKRRLWDSRLLYISCGMSDDNGNALISYDALSQTYMIYKFIHHQHRISYYNNPGATSFDKSSLSYSQQ